MPLFDIFFSFDADCAFAYYDCCHHAICLCLYEIFRFFAAIAVLPLIATPYATPYSLPLLPFSARQSLIAFRFVFTATAFTAASHTISLALLPAIHVFQFVSDTATPLPFVFRHCLLFQIGCCLYCRVLRLLLPLPLIHIAFSAAGFHAISLRCQPLCRRFSFVSDISRLLSLLLFRFHCSLTCRVEVFDSRAGFLQVFFHPAFTFYASSSR